MQAHLSIPVYEAMEALSCLLLSLTLPSRCDMMPCRPWTPEGKRCYICSQNCDKFSAVRDPSPRDLLESLTCDRDCDKVVVTSSGPAAVWQNKRTGLFSFIGEHNGRPCYQNNATKEHLYYTFTGAEWLVGPDFRKPHAGNEMKVFVKTTSVMNKA